MPVQKSEVSILTSVSNPERWTRKFIKIIIKCKIRKGRWREREGKKLEKQNRQGHAEMSAGRHWGKKKARKKNLKLIYVNELMLDVGKFKKKLPENKLKKFTKN